MAETHGHDADHHDDSHHAVEEEDAVRTPAWLPFVGIGLLLIGSLWTYLWIYPGTMSASSTAAAADGGVEDGAVGNPPNPAPANPAPAPGH